VDGAGTALVSAECIGAALRARPPFGAAVWLGAARVHSALRTLAAVAAAAPTRSHRAAPASAPMGGVCRRRNSMAARAVWALAALVMAAAEKVDIDELRVPRLSHTSVLLPPHEEGDYSTVRLYGYNGCFEWTTKNPNLIR
jgi:hypothetical protein